jgi:hypothetical protein
MHTEYGFKKFKGRDYFGDLEGDGMITLRWLLRKQDVNM